MLRVVTKVLVLPGNYIVVITNTCYNNSIPQSAKRVLHNIYDKMNFSSQYPGQRSMVRALVNVLVLASVLLAGVSACGDGAFQRIASVIFPCIRGSGGDGGSDNARD